MCNLMETQSKHTTGEVLMKFDFLKNDFNQHFGFGHIFLAFFVLDEHF